MDLRLLVGMGLALVAAAVLALWREPVFGFVRRSRTFVHDVRAEVHKVVWPSWDDLRKSTIVITILVIIIGIVIGLMDFLFSKLLIDFLGRAIG